MERKPGYVYFVSFVAAVGGLLFGFDTAIIAGAMGYFRDQFAINSLQEGWAVSSALVGCIFGAAFAGMVSDRIGRKRVLILSAILFTISAIGSAIPRDVNEFMIARFIGGLGVGAAAMLSPLYISEIAPAAIRGRLVSLNQMTIVTGMLCAYFVNWVCADIGPTNWRWMFGSETLPAAVFLALMFFVPESPRWLVKQGRADEAMGILTRVNGEQQAQVELTEIKETLAQETGSVKQLLEPGLRIALLIGIALAIFQQITGINGVLYYAPRIFESVGLERSSAILQSVIIGAVNMLMTLVAIMFVDKLGRKPLLLIASAGMGVSFVLTAIAFQYRIFSETWILIFILMYIGFFALAMGPVIWVVLAEIFPTRVRGRAMSIATVFLWIACFAVSLSFPVLADKFSEALNFVIYAVMCFITFLFVWIVLPETKGKTLEEIERHWLKK
ncbi:MAG TPA: sugar porter family MFS transporter [bacterium]|nr:sugar porter family MFS transporter [bacterium]HPN43779.1 sugar porter family MFS transporter [bacterium]